MDEVIRKHFCIRCGREGVRIDTATEEVWQCPVSHGVIFTAPLPVPAAPQLAQPKAPAKGKPVSPPEQLEPPEEDVEEPKKKEDEEQEQEVEKQRNWR